MNLIRNLRKICTTINPVLTSKIMYRKIMKKNINLKEPQTFNEKITYLKLFKYPYMDDVIKCSDKYAVREYLTEHGFENYLVKLIGVWDDPEDIDWNQLPQKFVLKCNHGCAYNIICTNKNNLNIEKSKKMLNKWFKEDFGKVSGELHYSKIKRKIICEEYLEDEIRDYKFFCFKGKPEFFYISQNVSGDFHNMQADFFYTNGTPTEFRRIDHQSFKVTPLLPDNLKEMVSLAEKLSKNFEFVRVDLFDVKGKIYFSELTFSPCAGFMPITPQNYDLEIGKKIDVNSVKVNK